MKKIIYSSFFVMLLAFSSCESYLDVNEDQTNSPSSDALAPNQMLAGAINNFTNLQIATLSPYGNRISYVWGLNSGFTSVDAAYNYNFDSSTYGFLFENTYIFADNFQDIIDKKADFPDYSYHFGVAKVLKVMCMDYVTALYGDVPYSEAFNSSISSPKYDDDKTIIPALFKELDEAKAYLNTPDAIALGREDIVFGGSTASWLKFVNTIELKLLMRLSKTTDPALVAIRTSRFALLSANQDFITTDVTNNPGYNNTAVGQRSPNYRIYGLDAGLAAWTSANRANAAGDYIANLVNGTLTNADITADVVDPRRANMFSLVGGKVVGNVQGIFPLTAISRVSSFFIGRVGATPDDNGMNRAAYIMLASESYFLQAEARQRGFLTGGSAQADFYKGISSSFNFYSRGFGTATFATLNPTTYIAATEAKNGLGWTGSANKINAIMTQKYLALANWSGIELYFDQLRTGFPNTPVPSAQLKTTKPNRLIYPSSEYSSNSTNVPNITNAELFTVNAKTPYYLQ